MKTIANPKQLKELLHTRGIHSLDEYLDNLDENTLLELTLEKLTRDSHNLNIKEVLTTK